MRFFSIFCSVHLLLLLAISGLHFVAYCENPHLSDINKIDNINNSVIYDVVIVASRFGISPGISDECRLSARWPPLYET